MIRRAIVGALLLALGASHALAAGMALTSENRSTGSESSLIVSRSPADCFATDDHDLRTYQGDLGPGQSFTAVLVFCRHDSVVIQPGAVVTGDLDNVVAWFDAKAPLRLTVGGHLAPVQRSGADRFGTGCSFYQERQPVDDDWYSGPVSVVLTNEGTKAVKGITLTTEVTLGVTGDPRCQS